ncbi:MAG: hypothetical protein JXR78_04725 [Victivallales bacterium]|nr:hypothetical protein [Victivallales bacterium]
MSENTEANGCMGCLGLGCGTYIILSLIGLVMYWWGDNPKEKVMNSTFREVFEAQFQTTTGTRLYGIDDILTKAKFEGVDIDSKLRNAIAYHNSINKVEIEEEKLGKELSLVRLTMYINGTGASGQPIQISAGINFMLKPKSLLDLRHQAEMFGIKSMYVSNDGDPKYMDFAEYFDTTVRMSDGFVFFTGLFKKSDKEFNEVITHFIKLLNENIKK